MSQEGHDIVEWNPIIYPQKMLHENNQGQRLRFYRYQNTGVEWGSIVVLDIWARLSRQENLEC